MKNTQTETTADLEIPALTEEDFKNAIPAKPFLDEIKKPTTIRLKPSTIYYFQLMAKNTGIPYQTLINMYLDDCVKNQRKPDLTWK